MSLLRLIARLDIKGPNVVKGIRMEGLRVMGDPVTLANRYAEEADEILYVDTVASLYGRNNLESLLERTTHDVFVPVTVAGGIKSRADVKRLLDAGADKVTVNTAAIANPALVRELSDYYGSQAVVVSIEAQRTAGGWEALTDCGRQRTGRDAVKWAKEAVALGAGELLITSVDRDGTRLGFDLGLMRAVAEDCPVPVTACGGMGRLEHLREVLTEGRADAVAMASVLHYGRLTIGGMREWLSAPHQKGLAYRSSDGLKNC